MGAKNESLVDYWLDEDSLGYLSALARDGYTFDDIAKTIGIGKTTLWEWRKDYPEINDALVKGRARTDYRVENALLKSALGYRTKESKTILELDRKTGKLETIRVERIEKDIAPNSTSCQVWLYNRLPDKWKKNRDPYLELDDEESSIKINVIRTDKREDSEKSPDEDIINSELTIENSMDKDEWKQIHNKKKTKPKKQSDDTEDNKEEISARKKKNKNINSLKLTKTDDKPSNKQSRPSKTQEKMNSKKDLDAWPDDWED